MLVAEFPLVMSYDLGYGESWNHLDLRVKVLTCTVNNQGEST